MEAFMEAFGLDCTRRRCIQVAMGRRRHEGWRLSVRVASQRFEQPRRLLVTSLPQDFAFQASHEPVLVAMAALLMSRTSDLLVQTPGGGGDGGRRSGHVVKLRRRELNPGLPRDRRKYSPLYYSGSAGNVTARSFATALLLSVGPAFLNLRAGRGPSECCGQPSGVVARAGHL